MGTLARNGLIKETQFYNIRRFYNVNQGNLILFTFLSILFMGIWRSLLDKYQNIH